MTRAAHTAVRNQIGRVNDIRYFSAGDRLQFDDVTVHTIRTPHDGIDTVCFVIEHEGRRLGIMTDLGHPFAALSEALASVDAAYLESNYDAHLLRTGRYAEHLKRRIAGKGGHLSNDEAAQVMKQSINGRFRWLAAAHLSEENNRPDLAVEAHRRRVGASLPVFVASRYEVGRLLEV